MKGGTWRTLMVPDRTLGRKGHPWCLGWCCFTLKKICWKFQVNTLIRLLEKLVDGSGGWGWVVIAEIKDWLEPINIWNIKILFYRDEINCMHSRISFSCLLIAVCLSWNQLEKVAYWLSLVCLTFLLNIYLFKKFDKH